MQLRAQLDNFDDNDKYGLDCSPDGPGRTQQHFREECDINTIVERFGLTGHVPQVLRLPEYGDYTGIFDFQSAMNAINEAQKTFMSLPAKIRSRFENDPQQLLDFVSDPENTEEAIALGLATKPVTDDPTQPPATAPAPATPGATAPVPPPVPAPK